MKKTILLFVVLILIVAAFMYWGPADAPMPVTEESADTTESIEADLSQVEVEELDSDFELLDSDINSL